MILGHNLDILQKKSRGHNAVANHSSISVIHVTVTWRSSPLKMAKVVMLFYSRLIAQFVSLLFLLMAIYFNIIVTFCNCALEGKIFF